MVAFYYRGTGKLYLRRSGQGDVELGPGTCRLSDLTIEIRESARSEAVCPRYQSTGTLTISEFIASGSNPAVERTAGLKKKAQWKSDPRSRYSK